MCTGIGPGHASFCVGMDSIEAEMGALLEPYTLSPNQYIRNVISKHGFTGLARGETVLPDGTLDAAEYLRLMSVNKELLETAIKDEALLNGYVAEPESIPSYIRDKYGRFGAGGINLAKTEMEQALRNKRDELNQHYNYVFSLTCNRTIIDGEAFKAKMSPLLAKYMEVLMQKKHDEAERIVASRPH